MLLYFHNLQNRSGKINVHATHTLHAMHDLRIAAGHLRDGFEDQRVAAAFSSDSNAWPELILCAAVSLRRFFLTLNIDVRGLDVRRNELAIDQIFHGDRLLKDSRIDCHIVY